MKPVKFGETWNGNTEPSYGSDSVEGVETRRQASL